MTMLKTLRAWCDRAGQCLAAVAEAKAGLAAAASQKAGLAVLVVAGLATAVPAAAEGPGKYAARRFDVAVTVRDNGSLDVTETIEFEFQTGTFKKVWREIPSQRTDGIEIVQARMDGAPFARGDDAGQIAVSGRNRIRVEWRFQPTGPSIHTFELRYIARGVAYREGDVDVVRWRLLPTEHKYAIASVRGTLTASVPPTEAREPESRRAGPVSQTRHGATVEIAATDIKTNGWVLAELRYPAGHLTSSLPAWQLRNEYAAALGPRWTTAACVLFVACLFVLAGVRQAYVPPHIGRDETTTTTPPEPLPAALAAVLAARGGTMGYQPGATLLDLADRGVLTVRELPRSFGSRNYELARVPGLPAEASAKAGSHALDEHEQTAIDIAFAGGQETVTMSKARARLARRSRRFTTAVNGDLAARGFLDVRRKAVRNRFIVLSAWLLIISGVGCIVAAALIRRFEGWAFVLPLALAAAGLVGLMMVSATTPLSDHGLVQANRWRGFRRHLKSLTDSTQDRGAMSVSPRWIVYGIAVGLETQWAGYLKRNPSAAPPWFLAATPDAGPAFAAFVGSNAATSGGHGGGGSAGGGGSGAG